MIFNNTWQEYLIALAIFVGLVVILALVKKFIMMRAQRFVDKSRTDIDDAIFRMLNTVKPAFYWFISFYIAVQWLDFTGVPERIIDSMLVIWVTFQVVVALQVFIDLFASKKLVDADDRSTEIVSSLVSVISKIVLWTVGLLFVLSNLGVNIVSLIAGLGIGGLAVALAAQNILEDLFSSLSIYFDRLSIRLFLK